jgi:hypothetical protein
MSPYFGLILVLFGALVGAWFVSGIRKSAKQIYERAIIETLNECQDTLWKAGVLTAEHVARFNVIRVNLDLPYYKSNIKIRDISEE